MIYWTESWVPICGHFFWNNHIGANKFCQRLGYEQGHVSGNGERESYSVDAFKIGKCNDDDDWLQCGGGCNDYDVGGTCSNDVNMDCSAGQLVKINITCKGNISETNSCKGILIQYLTNIILPRQSINEIFSTYLCISFFVIPGACVSHICENNGICINDLGEPKCLCIEGYTGERCENGRIRK